MFIHSPLFSYEHFDGVTCRVFRDEDYLPPEDTAPKEVIVPDDDTLEQTLDRALMSVCPRCGRVRVHHPFMAEII